MISSVCSSDEKRIVKEYCLKGTQDADADAASSKEIKTIKLFF